MDGPNDKEDTNKLWKAEKKKKAAVESRSWGAFQQRVQVNFITGEVQVAKVRRGNVQGLVFGKTSVPGKNPN